MWVVAARRMMTMMIAQNILHQRVEEEARGARLVQTVFVEVEEQQ